jgi:lipopolysaccharide export system permease protein
VNTIKRLIYKEIVNAVGFVILGFLGLFFFFDLIDELQWVGKGVGLAPGRQLDLDKIYLLPQAFSYVTLIVPSHVYELMPIAVLIGTIFVMARLAQSSEFTILRTSGLGPVKALRVLSGLGLAFVVLTFLVGDYLSPFCDRQAQLMRSKYFGQITVGQTGAWLNEKQPQSHQAVNVGAITPEGNLKDIKVYEFSTQGKLLSLTQAQQGEFANNADAWLLHQVHRDEFNTETDPQRITPEVSLSPVKRLDLETLMWPTNIKPEMVAVALLKPERMSAIDLFQYIRHLQSNAQTAQLYEIEFWKKVFYPISCLVMVVLALPFGYLHFRSGNIATMVFAGVMIGISFFLMNNVFGYIGNLNQWVPWITAAAPGLIYSLVSLTAFGWLVLKQ